MSRPDQSIAFLRSYGFSVFRLPRASAQPLGLMHREGKDWTRLGRVADLVTEVTDDRSLPKDQRRQRQIKDAPHKSASAKLIKIADKISNIRARIRPQPDAAERADLTDYVDWAEQVFAGCRGGNAALERIFDETVKAARSTL